MGEIKQINKHQTYYFYNDVINLDESDESKIKVDRKNFNDIDIHYLGYEYKKETTERNETNSVIHFIWELNIWKVNLKKVKVIMYGI